MSYQIKFNPEHKAIRRNDNLHLGLETHNGILDAYVLRKEFHSTPSILIGIPLTENNISVLGVADSPKLHKLVDNGGQWIIPPFKLQPWVLRKEGPFTRIGKLEEDSYDYDPDKTATLFDGEYNPYVQDFVPEKLITDPTVDPTSRDDWPVKVHVSGHANRHATGEESAYPIVPWAQYALGDPDLWLEQFRCWCLDQPIPTEIRGEHD